MNELSGTRPDTRQDSTPDATDHGDRRTVPVDETGTENWAETTSPLTRSQYADHIRRELEARQEANGAGGTDIDEPQTTEGDQEREHPPEPRAGQENAPESPGQARSDADPARREQVADAAAVAPEQTADVTAGQEAAGEDPRSADDQAVDNAEGERRVETVKLEAADRTVGDTTPTGIGLKPTGEQLKEMENDKPNEKRADRFFGKAFDLADDIQDSTSHIAEAVREDWLRGPGDHPSAHSSYVVHDELIQQPDGPGAGDMVGNLTVAAIMLAAGFHRLASHHRKGAEA